ncbi:hypothetical protein BJX64DRAFT_126713 [Aspergillus heterothallicus]
MPAVNPLESPSEAGANSRLKKRAGAQPARLRLQQSILQEHPSPRSGTAQDLVAAARRIINCFLQCGLRSDVSLWGYNLLVEPKVRRSTCAWSYRVLSGWLASARSNEILQLGSDTYRAKGLMRCPPAPVSCLPWLRGCCWLPLPLPVFKLPVILVMTMIFL